MQIRESARAPRPKSLRDVLARSPRGSRAQAHNDVDALDVDDLPAGLVGFYEQIGHDWYSKRRGATAWAARYSSSAACSACSAAICQTCKTAPVRGVELILGGVDSSSGRVDAVL